MFGEYHFLKRHLFTIVVKNGSWAEICVQTNGQAIQGKDF